MVFWPFLVLAGVYFICAFFGLLDQFDARSRAVLGVLFWLISPFLIWRGWRAYTHPSDADARKALDKSSDLRPISTLTDHPVEVTDDGQILWDEHTLRLKKAAERLPVPWFGALWRKLDPYVLRAVLPVLLIGGMFAAGGNLGSRFAGALSPDIGVLMGAENVRVEAWITPPEYTRRPPVFLKPETQEIRVPAGSEVTLRAQAPSAPRLSLRSAGRGKGQRFDRTPDGAYETKAIIENDTKLAVNWWGRRAGLTILTSPDAAPLAEFVTPPVLGAKDKTELTWKVSDDYGVARLELAFRLVDPHPEIVNDERRASIALPAPSLKEASEDSALDLTRHPWAGLMVSARLVATDGSEQEGFSEPHEFVLPEKLFLQPLARAAQDIRVTVLREPRPYSEVLEAEVIRLDEETDVKVENFLEAAPDGIKRAALMLEAITHEPYRFFPQYEPYIGLESAKHTILRARTLEEAAQVDGLLWAIALKAEYGSAADALAALLAAKRALEKALRDGASEEEIRRLTDAFRQAAENYVQAKLAEAIANGVPESEAQEGLDGQQGGGGQGLGQGSFEEMLNALEDLTETGATDQARQLLSDITNLLENLEFQQGNGSGSDGFALPNDGEGEEDDQESDEEQELADQLEDLSDALREQRELNDDTLEARRRQLDEQRQQAENQRQQQSGEQQGGEQQSGQEQGGQEQGGEQQGSQSGSSGQAGRQFGEGEDGAGLTREELAERQAQIGELLAQLAEGDENGPGGLGEEDGEGTTGGGEDGDEEGAGGITGEDLEDVLAAQRRAERALGRGQFGLAQRSQEQVTEGLRELASELSGQLDELANEEGAGGPARDPFGNEVGAAGGLGGSDDVNVPDKSERQRALDILEELRRRYDQATDPEEREYLKRLLDRF